MTSNFATLNLCTEVMQRKRLRRVYYILTFFAMRAIVPRGEASVAAMPFDGTTGLAGVKTIQSENNDIYSLSGIKVNGEKLPKGVYITNGKKVVIK